MGTKNSSLVSLALLLAFACSDSQTKRASPSQSMRVDSELTLWAWHGEHDLRFLAERKVNDRPVSVAYLARRLVVRPEGVEAQLRSKALLLDENTQLTAVVRIEIESALPSESLTVALPQLIEHLVIAASEKDVATLQIDFDAPARLRPQYRQLLQTIRQRLPVGHQLEMTALASWCLGDPWIDEGLVDAVVPMLFEMGPEGPAIRQRLQSMDGLPAPCTNQIGVSTTDVLPPLHKSKRLFVFAPGPWTRDRLDRVERSLVRGHWEPLSIEGSNPHSK